MKLLAKYPHGHQVRCLGCFEMKSSDVKLSSELEENFPKICYFAIKQLHNC